MKRRTKIVCTLGPASASKSTIERMVDAGMNVARLNFSHGTHKDHGRLIEIVREVATTRGVSIPIMQDLQGPKIRIGDVANGRILLIEGQEIILTSSPVDNGSGRHVHINYPGFEDDVEVGGSILLDDGRLELTIVRIGSDEVVTQVVVGGPLRSRKGVNMPHMNSGSTTMTEKDIRDLEFGLAMKVDFVALSFVRTERDVTELVNRIRDSGSDVGVIAKIEKPEAVDDLEEILREADGIMVARGDLGIEMPLSKVPMMQKRIVRRCLASAKPVITATQMLESMMHNPRPTRAEASDVANAVLDGTDAVMLSGETAAGKHPVRVIEVMDEIVRAAESSDLMMQHAAQEHASPDEQEKVMAAISFTATRVATEVGAAAIACLTHSGATARSIARHRPDIPVYAFTDNPRVVGRMGIVWGTEGVHIPFQMDTDAGVGQVHEMLLSKGLARTGDRIVITAGMPLPTMGRTNMIHVSQL
ncbi:MAG TPA: pyruvate kinase [Rhodothermia bacterium]